MRDWWLARRDADPREHRGHEAELRARAGAVPMGQVATVRRVRGTRKRVAQGRRRRRPLLSWSGCGSCASRLLVRSRARQSSVATENLRAKTEPTTDGALGGRSHRGTSCRCSRLWRPSPTALGHHHLTERPKPPDSALSATSLTALNEFMLAAIRVLVASRRRGLSRLHRLHSSLLAVRTLLDEGTPGRHAAAAAPVAGAAAPIAGALAREAARWRRL